ncbi:MAG: TlpA family protein disulfide reductase, partial [Vicinamibacterales bacterium]
EALRTRGRPVVLVFLNPGCKPCLELIPDVEGWQAAESDRLTIAVVSKGGVDYVRDRLEGRHLVNVLVQTGNELRDAYRVPGAPGAIVITADGRVGSTPVGGVKSVRAIVHAMLARDATPQPLA